MATQTGVVRLQGAVGGLVFAKDGSVRQQQPSNKAAFAAKESMARVRENANEFGTAGAAGKLLREALRGAVQGAKGRYTVARVTQLMRKVIGLDASSVRGMRGVTKAAAVATLPGFNFNDASPLGSTLHAPYTVSQSGAVTTVALAGFIPLRDVAAPQGATHVALEVAGAAIKFASGSYHVAVVGAGAGTVVLDSTSSNVSVTLTLPAAPAVDEVLVVVLGVNFFQEVNGHMYSLNTNGSSPLAVVYAG